MGSRAGFSSATWLILPLYALLALALTLPVLPGFSTAIPSSGLAWDPSMQAFLLGWDVHAIRSPSSLFDPPIFHPEPNTLTYMDSMIGEAVLAAPLVTLRGVAAGYNFVFLLSFVLSGWGTYRLARMLGAPRFGAFLAGFLFAFCPYRFGNLDLLNQLQTQFLPIGLWFGIRFLRRHRVRDAIGTAGTLVVQTYFGWYYAYYLLIALGIILVFAWLTKRLGSLPVKKLALVGLASVMAVAPIVLPYAWEHRALPEFRRTLGESALYSADVTDYGKMYEASVLRLPLPTGRQPYWPGLVAVALAVWALSRWRQVKAQLAEIAAVSLSAFVLSLGPILHAGGARIWIPLPYALMYYVIPGFSGMRAPARFAALVALGVCAMAGVACGAARDWRPAHRRAFQVTALALALLFAWARPLRMLTLPTRERVAPAYAFLASRRTREPLLEIPVPATDGEENQTHALRQFCALLHGHPRLDGTSGFVSRRYRAFRSEIQSFPDSQALDRAEAMGARLILVHYGDYRPAEAEALRRAVSHQPRLRPLASFGPDDVYDLASEHP